MKLHTNTMTAADIARAAHIAGTSLQGSISKGSRSRSHAFDVAIAGSGRSGGQWGTQDYQAATWDEWGIFLAELFNIDPAMHCRAYESADHFHWVTGDRFRHLTPLFQHKRHKWQPQGLSATGSYCVAVCDCGAVNRWVAVWRGYKWADISDDYSEPTSPIDPRLEPVDIIDKIDELVNESLARGALGQR